MHVIGLLLLGIILSGCNGKASPPVEEDSLLSARISLQSSRLKSLDGFNELNKSLISNSFNMLTKVEAMLKGMNDNKDILIDIIKTLEQSFQITSNEPITIDTNVSSTVPPFAIGAAGLTDNFLLLSSSSRFLTSSNALKTRFKTPTELDVAWLRAVEFSDGVCVYVALQSVDSTGAVTSASNTLVVPLVAADQCSIQL